MDILHLCLFLVIICLSQAADQDVVCPAGQSEPLGRTVTDGERLHYKTQAGRRYTNRVNCTVTFNLGPTCARMKFFCKKVNLRRGDKITISYEGKTKRITGRRSGIRIRSRENLRVKFNSNRRKISSGAGRKGCLVSCIKTAPTVAPSTPSSTTSGMVGTRH